MPIYSSLRRPLFLANLIEYLPALRKCSTTTAASSFLTDYDNDPNILYTRSMENPITSKCEPTEILLEVMKKNKLIADKVKRIQREFEVCLAKKVKSIEPFQDI
jgi:hypothetical protein